MGKAEITVIGQIITRGKPETVLVNTMVTAFSVNH